MSEPTKQCQGWWTPIEIVELMEAGDITPVEMVLLTMINSLVSKDRGCFASNDYLAERLHISKSYVSELISSLTEKGLIVRVAYNGRQRYLETPWSRIDPSKVTTKWLRRKLEARVRPNEVRVRPSEPCIRPNEVRVRPGANRIRNNKDDETKGIDKDTEGVSDETPNGVHPVDSSVNGNNKHPTNKQNGQFYDQTTLPVKNPKPGLSKFHLKCGERFKSILTSHNRSPGNQNRKTLAEGFRLLEIADKVPQAEIIAVLKWYRDNFDGQYVPKVYKSIDFRDRWNKLRDAMQRGETEQQDGFAIVLQQIESGEFSCE